MENSFSKRNIYARARRSLSELREERSLGYLLGGPDRSHNFERERKKNNYIKVQV
jgi:hypothetical protein